MMFNNSQGLTTSSYENPEFIDLSGPWFYRLDPLDEGVNKHWFEQTFKESISLPGTLNTAGIGEKAQYNCGISRENLLHLVPEYVYTGVAWYTRNFDIPVEWAGKKLKLKLERIIWQSEVWIDGNVIGQAESLSTPHVFVVDSLNKGSHRLHIRIDNSKQYNINDRDLAHAYTDHTQTKWNGVLGDIRIERAGIIQTVQVYPDYPDKKLGIKIILDGNVQHYSLKIQLGYQNTDKALFEAEYPCVPDEQEKQLALDLHEVKIQPWDENSPHLYKLSVSLINADNGETRDQKTEQFGFRNIAVKDRHLVLNNRRIFLRGTLDCCIFPLTGHPPLAEDQWDSIFNKLKSHGLNHVRFHSWCPPEAAFMAADHNGIYLQVELPNWNLNLGRDPGTIKFLKEEAGRIVLEYGNHPSFLLMSMGNELEGDFRILNSMLKELKRSDPRHLYTTTTFTFQEGHGTEPEDSDDFFISQWTGKGWLRGQGVFDDRKPHFNGNYDPEINHIEIPVITHEIGQYAVFPDFNEIDKYTGSLIPVNLMSLRQAMEEKGLIHLSDQFFQASGKFAALLYKEEIERALKTNDLSGFQLLGLQDFPGQGTALVGLLDAFWESKNLIDAFTFRQFCSELVPLIWFEKAIYSSGEKLQVDLGAANFFKDLVDKSLIWTITGPERKEIFREAFHVPKIERGKTSKLVSAVFKVPQIDQPLMTTMTLEIEGTRFVNSWPVWFYPVLKDEYGGDVCVTESFREAEDALGKGMKVLLSPDPDHILGIEGKFVPVFWSPVHFPDQPGTMGVLVDPNHPVFNAFPTEDHSNWQWWDICKRSKSIEINELRVTPLVRVVDNFFSLRSLSNLFEVCVGKGKLVFSSIDLTHDIESRPATDQLKKSILNYMDSEYFNPKTQSSFSQITKYYLNV